MYKHVFASHLLFEFVKLVEDVDVFFVRDNGMVFEEGFDFLPTVDLDSLVVAFD